MNRYIAYANEQYRRLMGSKNPPSENKREFFLYTKFGPLDPAVFRLKGTDKDYLIDRGREWRRLNMIDSYFVSEKAVK